jgi:hypothetical protein
VRSGRPSSSPRIAPALIASIFLFACAGGSGGGGTVSTGPGPGTPTGTPSGTAAVTVTISDPVVCGTSASGPFKQIYITIVDIPAFTNPTPSLQGGVDLTPNLSQSPVQIDLLGPATGCILAILGGSTSIAAGTYQQLAVFLAGSNQATAI